MKITGKVTFILFLFIFICRVSSFAAENEYVYFENTADSSGTCIVSILEHSDSTKMAVEYEDEVYEIKADSDFSAQQCRIIRKDNNNFIIFTRLEDIVQIVAPEKETIVKIDRLKWYQTAFSLKEFVKSNKSVEKFYMASISANEDNPGSYGISMLKMKAKKKGEETIVIGEQSVETQRIKISLTGFKSHFWSIDYWYRIADGIAVRYVERRGGPGTPDTVGELIYEK